MSEIMIAPLALLSVFKLLVYDDVKSTQTRSQPSLGHGSMAYADCILYMENHRIQSNCFNISKACIF